MGWRISHTRRHRCLKLPENTIDEQRKLNSALTQNKAPNRWAAGAGGELNAHPILPQMSGAGERLTGNIVVVSVRVRPIDNKEGQPGEHREEKE